MVDGCKHPSNYIAVAAKTCHIIKFSHVSRASPRERARGNPQLKCCCARSLECSFYISRCVCMFIHKTI